MRTAVRVVLCLLVGVGVGAAGALLVDQRDDPEPGRAEPVVAAPTPVPHEAPPAPAPQPRPQHQDRVLLAWTAGGLPSGFADAVAALPRVDDLSVVTGELVGLVESDDADGAPVQRLTDGWVVPIDLLGIDPAGYAGFAEEGRARRAIRGLADGEALLGETSAALRHVGVGGRLRFDSGGSLRVAGIVPDQSVAGAEVVVTTATAAVLGAATPRFLLLHHRGPRAPVEGSIRSLAGEPVRTRAPGETPFLRHADAVLPQALIKARFGEFSYRPAGDGPVTLDPGWLVANIVEADLPLLGHVRCHRALIPSLRGALLDLEAANLGHLIASYEGCFNARTIAGSTQLSRHAWGAAVDVNFSANPTGVTTAQDPRLVAVFEQWGFGSGDVWLVPDSGHFEYVSPPTWKVVP